MRAILRRSTEATSEQVIATGAYGGFGVDPIDGDRGYRPLGQAINREVPGWTLEKARTYSVAAYRSNPMARAIIDTYVAFAVGDSGVRLNVSDPGVREVADQFWSDPANALQKRQPAMLVDHLLMGEQALEIMQGPVSGVCRFSPVDTSRVLAVLGANPLHPEALDIRNMDGPPLAVVFPQLDDRGRLLRQGEALWSAQWKALLTDRRGTPFLQPVLDWLDSYDQVLSNLVDRTSLARYIALTATVDGTQGDVDEFIKARGGIHVPSSGTIEVTNKKVTWGTLNGLSGSFEDTNTAGAMLTQVAGGAGLAKTWLAEPDGANRATSLTMAEPVRRRVGAVQNMFLDYQSELVRTAVDRAVAAGRLSPTVAAVGPGAEGQAVPAASCVSITGPAIAAADAQVTAQILVSLSQGLEGLVVTGLLSPEAAKVAVQKAWEQFAGVPYTSDLDKTDGSKADELATLIDRPGVVPAVNLKLA